MGKRVHLLRMKLTGEQRKLAGQLISKEIRTGKYPHEQAVAIGISRARAATVSTQRYMKRKATISAIMKRYPGDT